MAPPLLALDAEAVIAGPEGHRAASRSRRSSSGVRRTVLAPDELLVEIVVPAPGPRSGGNYLRHTPRRELDIAVVGVASQLTLSNGVCTKARIALAAVAPMPVRATAAERALEGQAVTPDLIERAAALAVEAARPISDQRGSADFRRHLVQRPDPPHAHHRPRARGRLTNPEEPPRAEADPELHDQRRADRGARPAVRDAAGRAAREARPDRAQGGLRHGRLRRLHRAPGRAARRELPGPGAAGARPLGADDRGPRRRRARSTRSRTPSCGTACPSAASASRAC